MDTTNLIASAVTWTIPRPADPTANGGRMEAVFIDTGLADWQTLMAGVAAGIEIVLIDGSADGLAQMAAWAAGRSGYDAIHVLSHGAAGQVRLGALLLDTAAVAGRSAELAALGGALTQTGDLLLYGCDVASGDGTSFIAALAEATGADVAASTDRTGSFAAGGNWVLEAGIGSLETSSLVFQGYAHALAPLAPTAGNDSLTGTVGDDSIAGLAGNDTLRGNDGNDTLDGGDGDDSLYGDAGNDSLEGGDGNDYLDGGTGNDTLVGGAGNDNLVGGAGNDSLVGGAGNDTFSIGSLSDYTNDDIIDGGAGDDTIRFFSTTAGDTLVLNSNVTDSDGTISVVISGTATGGINSAAVNIDASAVTLAGGVTISGNGEANTLTGSAQNDTISAANGNDTLFGGAGNDNLSGGNGDDSIVGGTGNDYLDGGAGNDSLFGGDGDDTLSGGAGTDRLFGGDGDDVFLISAAADHTADETINGGAGNDVIRFVSSSSGAILVLNSNLTDSDGTITIDVSRRADGTTSNSAVGVDASAVTLTGGVTIIGNAGKNVLTGSAYNDSINGGNGDNVLDGGDGDDTIIGGTGNDTIIGGAGTDSLFGGSFNDVFGIAAGSHHTANETIDGGTSSDTIRFYSATDGDTLTLNSNLKNGSNNFTIAITGDVNGAASNASVNVDASAVTLAGGLKIFGSGGNNVLTGTAQSDSIEGGDGNDSINGGDGRDTLNGGDGNDTLIGGGNNDSLNGGDGDDSLEGGTGNDTLTGGAGNDTLTGGAGNDVFVDPNGDVITTLESGDIIRLTGGAAQMLGASHLQYDSGTKTLTVDWDKNGTFGGGSDVVITFTDAPSLTTFTITDNGAFADITMSAAPTGPTVTDANISISGGSGTGGAYKIGDTVTATWSNTATGDNNTDALTGVTMDFSQFGGGSAVAATNSNGIWTATYTITAGSIDATNRNVSVTATTASGSTTQADGTNATVDNVAPTLTLGNMAGQASLVGTNSTLRIGSTVTAIWDNSGSGDGSDNTDTIASVTADFSQFGGGSAVAMTNTGGVWTATYTVVAGSFDTTGRNVSITVTDNAGNSTTLTDTANHKLDNVAPTVTDANIAISGGTGTGGAYKIGDTVTATWDNTLSGDNNTDTLTGVTMDFSQFGGGSAVTATNSNGVWTATYTITSGSIDATSRNVSVSVTDNAGNKTTTADAANAIVDNQAPKVTDPAISISGGTGTGGAYKIGDTVTMTWDNTLAGDNNTDTLASVTVDFSQFGGGSAVAATNSNGVWTATHAITSAPGGTANLNVSVTATDNAGNVKTTADTTNATLEVAVPTVTDGNIAISGGSGTGGAYKIGDTVTATWDNTIDGDNNTDTVSGVTMDFSQFGGGSAVAATNSNGVWTATYTITSGSIDDTSRNVSVSASLAGGGTKTTADTTNATVDNQAPTVTDGHISVSGATGTGGAYKIGNTVTATWDDTLLNGDNNTDTLSSVTFDFSAFGGGSAVAGVNNGGVWTATYTITGGSIDATNRNVSVTVTDDAGNVTTTADSSNATVDNIAPTVTDANIAISGATGIGGAFKIGDTVTVVWNGTADGNTDTLAGVTVDFSQFGGGSSVAATNSNGVWTATHTIVSGSIDATGRNVSVTATDDAGNTKTGIDSSNAVVDDREPWARDSFIAISGATGTGGVYKIGDTVTATWDNRMVGGDNNTDSLTSVTFDFSAFGGSSAVAATQTGDIWTATYTITAGSIDAANRNVSITVTDDAGNTATGTDTTNATVDNVGLTVTDANISISGGTGTGGAFKAGDTVTMTWDNTLSGDNNTDTLAGVSVDFSQFSGGSAVTATNSNGVWTATYTITDGSVDATGRNVSVTVTDDAGNTTTRADTANATLDNVAPTVTDANISISGGTGTGGSFKTGDTVTAIWDNTLAGDNNTDTLASVTVDFSQFGGGSAVAATNSNGVWTATYTITAGSIDATGRNVSVSVTDDAGNTTTRADGTNASVDNVAPTVTDAAISISGGSGPGGAYKAGDTVTMTWDNTLAGDNNTDTLAGVTVDFSQFGGGSAVAATNSNGVWTATHTITTGSLEAANRNVSVTVTDNAGNVTTRADTTNATVDNAPPAAPAITGFSSDTGSSSSDHLTNDTTLVLSGTAEANALVTVKLGGNSIGTANANGSGAWTFDYTGTVLPAGTHSFTATATDSAGNVSTASSPFTVTVDTGAPSATLTLSDTSLDETGAATLTITFTEAPVGFALDDLSVSDATLSNLTVQAGSNGLVYTATLTPNLDVEATGRTVTLGTGWTDAAGNAPVATASSPAFSIDTLGVAGVIATPSGTVTSEAGGAVTVAIVPATRPRGDVTIPLSVSKPGEAQISVGSLTFTTANWDTPQTVTVTGLDDGVNDGAQAYNLVLGAITSTDSRYAGLDPADVALSNADDDPPSIALATATRDDSTTGDPTARVTGTADAGSKVEVWRDLDNDGVLDPEDTLLTSVQLGVGETAFAIDVPLPNNALTDLILVAVDADGHRSAPLDVAQRFRTVETGSGTNVTNESSVDSDGNERVDVEAVSEQAGGFAEVVLTDQTEDDGEPMLTASVSAGTRLVASGPATQQSSAVAGQTLSNSLLMIAAGSDETEKAALQQIASQMPAVTGFLGSSTPVTVRQIVVTASSGGATTGPVTIRGTADQGDGVAAVVLDTRQAAGSTEVNLDNVSIAVILGEARIGGGAGNNAAYGDSSAQFMRMGPGDDTLSGGGGNDTIASTTGNDLLSGDDGDDLVHGGEDNDTVIGGAGNDTVGGGTGDDYVFGDTGDDMLFGEDGDDWVIGGDGRDILSGGAGNDLLFGEGGNDTVFGGDGNDIAFGQEGDDILSLEAGNDIADGGDGSDTLFGGDGNDTLFGGAGADLLSLDAGNDLADGGEGNDTLLGGAGNDTLFGGAGADLIDGGKGNDVIFLIDGADTVWGGAGSDLFVLGTGGGGSVVMDFTAGTDRLALTDSSISLAGVIASARVVGGSTVLDLRPGSSVTIQGQTGDVARWFA
ncbi:DUF4347 domain-containing protein [Azospirillum argentinense]